MKIDALVLYRSRPARIVGLGDKFEIVLPDGGSKRVRDKDLTLLHPGPCPSLSALACDGDFDEAWQLLEGESATLAELAEYACGEFTPASAWTAWQCLQSGELFEGDVQAIRPRAAEAVEATRRDRAQRAARQAAWAALLERIRRCALQPGDARQLAELEQLAFGVTRTSRILSALGQPQTPQSAHRWLLKLNHWDETVNPQARRRAVPLSDPPGTPPMLDEQTPRLDLTALTSYAIDDEDSTDPDDAIAIDGERIWVHVADVSALVQPDDALDVEARQRGGNLYLPEGTVHMLPPTVTERLALGLADTSPAMSFGMILTADGELADVRIALTRVRVERMSYAQADACLHAAPFAAMKARLECFRERRRARGWTPLQLPEVSVRMRHGDIVIKPLPALEARQLVADAMLLAGTAAAEYARTHQLAVAFSTQAPPEQPARPGTLSEMFAYRRQFQRSRFKTEAAPHCGLGLPCYSQVTSPLRRYLDLVCHQQIRAHLSGERGISGADLVTRIGAIEAVIDPLRKAERESNLHWKLAWLQRHPDWQGEAVVLAQRGRKAVCLLPELALEVGIAALSDKPLDTTARVALAGVDLPELTARFRLV